jgi:peptide/nickel transport system ATP-binding protein
MPLLRLDGLSLSLDGTALLEDVTFSLDKGERLGLMGESGSGKSLLLRALLGLLPRGARVKGTIELDGAPMPVVESERAGLRGKRIGAVLHNADSSLDPLRTVATLISEAQALAGKPIDVPALLSGLGLDAKLAKYLPHDLSAAERRRLALGLAVAGQPDLLLADEPADGLDLIEQRRILDLIARQCSDRGTALVIASHDLKTLAMLSDKIVVMRGGKVIESGAKAEVFGHPRHEFTRAVLSAGRHRAKTLMRTPIGGTLLEVRNVTRRYRLPDRSLFEPRRPVMALDGVSLTVRAGESVGLIGPQAAGKSTLARIIVGLEGATSGELEFNQQVYTGTDLPRLLRHDISLVAADPRPTFDPKLPVGQSVAEPLQLELQRSVDELSTRLVEVVTSVGLSTDVLTRPPGDFTIGQLQRLAIARALVTRPRLVVLDEAVAALDVGARGEILVLLNRLRADFGLSFLIIGHDLDLMRIAADRVLVMDRGKIVEATTPAQLLEKPQHEVTQRLVAAQLPDVGIVPVF